MSSDIDKIRQYILSKNKGDKKFDDDDDIFENRLINSLQFVEFVIFIEEITGISIDMENIDLDDFRSITDIKRAFFAVS